MAFHLKTRRGKRTRHDKEDRPQDAPQPQETTYVELEEGQMVEMSREMIDAWADDYVCPITYELFYDPVRMQDGKLYERAAIEEYIDRTANGAFFRSPLTNQMISIVPEADVRTRNTIRRLVRSGYLAGEVADAWKAKDRDGTIMATLREGAAQGDVRSLAIIGYSYRDAKHGMRKDAFKAFGFLRLAANKDDANATSACGILYINGNGVEKDIPRGVQMLTRAGMLGSEHACAVLGRAFEEGLYQLPKSIEDARYWFRKARIATCKDSNAKYRDHLEAWLTKHDTTK